MGANFHINLGSLWRVVNPEFTVIHKNMSELKQISVFLPLIRDKQSSGFSYNTDLVL